jgi:hypothetical protein
MDSPGLDFRNQLIVETAQSGGTVYVVLGNGPDVRLIPITEEIDREALERDRANGMRYAGVLGMLNGRPKIALGPDAGSQELEALRYAAAVLVTEKFGDSIGWLDRLFSLPDTRMEANVARPN